MLDNDEKGSLASLFAEDTSMSNLKLFIGFSAVGASLLSHVYPAPFPRNWWCLLFCCAIYFALSGVLQLLLSFVELESIILLRARKDARSLPSRDSTSARTSALSEHVHCRHHSNLGRRDHVARERTRVLARGEGRQQQPELHAAKLGDRRVLR